LIDHRLIINTSLDRRDYRIDSSNNFLIIDKRPLPKSITVSYRPLFLNLDTPIYRKSKSYILRGYEENPFVYTPSTDNTENNGYKLNTAGNLSRGIGFGNRQDIVVNSNLNLQLSGQLSEEVKVNAVISDESNPIQPEGNTQQLQDFDQVYIQLEGPSTLVTMGDFLMTSHNYDYFTKYYKKSRGLQVDHTINTEKLGSVQLHTDLALARGRFSRNVINGIEGNRGPYRLSGSNNEIFIIIISGTERVFLDGKQLTRGEENDYIINYNSGEITFTPNVLITQYSRIVVEFQYSDRNYARSVLTGSAIWKNNQWTSYARAYTELDLKNQPFQQSLDGFDSLSGQSSIDILSQAGDNPNLAVIERIRPRQEFVSNRILYTRRNVGGQFIYEYAAQPLADTTYYEVSFTEVGNGNGSYQPLSVNANGRVFEYVGPGQGNFVPIEQLVPPKSYQLYTAGQQLDLGKTRVGWEVAASRDDQNVFSSIDDNNNVGLGGHLFWKSNPDTASEQKEKWKWTTNNKLEWKQADFRFVERYRPVEFTRKWVRTIENPETEEVPAQEVIGMVELNGRRKDGLNVGYNLDLYHGKDRFNGVSSGATAQFSGKKYRWNLGGEGMFSNYLSDTVADQNRFYRGSALIARKVGSVEVGIEGQLENSEFQLLGTDSLGRLSYRFTDWGVFASRRKEQNQWMVKYGERLDFRPGRDADGFGLLQSTLGKNVEGKLSQGFLGSNRIAVSGIYRQFETLNASLNPGDDEEVLQGRTEMNLQLLKRSIRSKTFYEIANGQEQRREFQYLEVQPGNGVYVWNDYDSNQVQTLDEFEIASELDRLRANYIRVFVPVQGFIQSRSNQFTQSIQFSPRQLLRNSNKKVLRWVSKLSTASTIRFQQKVIEPDLVKALNPFNVPLSDTALLSSLRLNRHSLYINRSGAVFGGEVTRIENGTKTFLTAGFDSRDNLEYRYKTRLNLWKVLTISTAFSHGEKQYTSAFNSLRNFRYTFRRYEPEINIQPGRENRITLTATRFEADNIAELGGERLRQWNVGGGWRYGLTGNGLLRLDYRYVMNEYNGDPGSTLAYELMNGLINGNNHTWSVNVQRNLSKGIQIGVSYEGRKSPNVPAVHIGRAQARYLF
jgi:hypothetical protein